MLLEFTLNNYLSFKDEQFISMETGARLRKFKEENTLSVKGIDILKNILIMGPNGSGKSNLLHGLNTMKKMILNPRKVVTDELPFMPFLLSDDTGKPTSFHIEFLFNEVFYNYSFSYNDERFINEKLSFKLSEGTQYKIYFERNEEEILIYPEEYLNSLKMVRKNSLFIYNLQDQNDKHAVAVYKWFKNVLYFFDDNNNIEKQFKLLEKEDNKKMFLEFLKAADFNIIDIELQKKTVELPEDIKELLSKLTPSLHLNNDIPSSVLNLRTMYKRYDSVGNVVGKTSLDLGMESAGTRKIIRIALSVIYCKEYNKILVMDEFDDSLHMSLSKALIEVFNSKSNLNQFILTTHQLELLDSNLRIDQIYLVEKDFKGESELFSLFDIDELNSSARSDVKRLKPYIEGRFGAIPIIDVQGMKKINNEELIY